MKKFFSLLFIAAGIAALTSCSSGNGGKSSDMKGSNLAVMAQPSGPFGARGSEQLNDGEIPEMPRYGGRGGGNFNNMQEQAKGVTWVEYEWNQPISTDEISVFWRKGFSGLLPEAYHISYWDGNEFRPVEGVEGLTLEDETYNVTKFNEVTTTRLRLDIDSVEMRRNRPMSNNILEWKVLASENCAPYPPIVDAGIDRSVITNGNTYLTAAVTSLTPLKGVKWEKKSGPGKVVFGDPTQLVTTAEFTTPGDYTLAFTATEGKLKSSDELLVKVTMPPPEKRLDVVYTKRYSIDNPLWNSRAKAIIVNWIPHNIEYIERTDLTQGAGGLDNFIEAGKALRGEPHGPHKGYQFANAWVHQTVESMCIALMVDPKGDPEIIAAQNKMKATLEKWIPIILAAQEPDGYLQTAYTLRDTTGPFRGDERWNPQVGRGNHEGYVAGYFIESAINHYTLTEGTDTRLYDAAKKLADCWVANIGPGKREWYDGHQEMEQALVRFGRFVNDMEGNGRGDSYIALAKYLLDCRGGGSEYDQSQVRVQEQYEAVGHAVRAVYSYSGMADVAAETRDVDYESAVMSLFDDMINRKYYVTGGVGSGETSEGFGPDYSLRHNAYCESCSSCGLIFFDYKMNIAYHDAKYADLYEETMYNALMGSLDIDGENFYYTNPLTSNRERQSWHNCPCCVGNIPRTLLMIPTWTNVKGDDGVYVNLFIGSTIKVENVAGTNIQMVQKTDYPWSGNISITVNPEESKEFTVYVRVPDRHTSDLYTAVPEVSGYKSLSVNGTPYQADVVNGYAEITRKWEAGDKIDMVLPMEVQRITSDDKVEANRGEVALRYGPLIYSVEKTDQDISGAIGNDPLVPEWRGDLLDGVMVIKGKWADGSPLLAIPYWARNNRDNYDQDDRSDKSIVWIKTSE